MTTIPLTLLAAHFIGDFILQSNWMALNKSKNTVEGMNALAVHALMYSLCFLPWGIWFFEITFVAHYITDYMTSRCTSQLWFFRMHEGAWQHIDVPTVRGTALEKERLYNPFVFEGGSRHWFFVMIGFDQLLHYTQLAITYKLLS